MTSSTARPLSREEDASIAPPSSSSFPSASVITVDNASLAYKQGKQSKTILSHISFEIAEGEFVVVLGASGSGKTSLLRLLAGYERVTEGEIRIFGEGSPKPQPAVGVVFQQANLFPWLSIRRNAEFGLKMKRMGKRERRQIAEEAIGQVGLADYGDYLPHQLSGGMKQRAAIARTLAAEPRLVLMDEPFGALDAITREHLQSLVKSLWKTEKRTFFFITHDVDEALFLATRIIVIGGSPGQIRVDKQNPFRTAEGGVSMLRRHPDYAAERQALLDALEGQT